jgi:hypothetical protein
MLERGMIMGYVLEISAQAVGMPSDVAESAFDAIADALYDSEGVGDVDLALDTSSDPLFTFSVQVDDDRPEDALTHAFAVVRSAIHAGGGSTPRWEERFAYVRSTMFSGALQDA